MLRLAGNVGHSTARWAKPGRSPTVTQSLASLTEYDPPRQNLVTKSGDEFGWQPVCAEGAGSIWRSPQVCRTTDG